MQTRLVFTLSTSRKLGIEARRALRATFNLAAPVRRPLRSWMSLECGGLCWEAALSPSHSNHADIIPGMDTNEIMKGLDAEIARIQQAKTILGGQEVRNGRTVAAELSCDIEF